MSSISAKLFLVQKDNCSQHKHSVRADTSQSTRECTSHPGKTPHHKVSSHSHLTSSQFLSASVVALTMLIWLSPAAGSLVNIQRWNQDNSQIKGIVLVCLQKSGRCICISDISVMFWSFALKQSSEWYLLKWKQSIWKARKWYAHVSATSPHVSHLAEHVLNAKNAK